MTLINIPLYTCKQTKSKADVAIIGAGLTTAIMLARRGYDHIQVCERFAEPLPPDDSIWSSVESERTYDIGICGRGQTFYVEMVQWILLISILLMS